MVYYYKLSVSSIHFTIINGINGFLCMQEDKLHEFWMLVLIVEAL